MIRVKDWAEFQHYKNRQPPWIRLYGKLLDDPEWFALQGRASWVLASCWLIAREDETQAGLLPSVAKLAFRLRISVEELSGYIRQLNHWLVYDASDLLAECKQLATPETETETETEEDTAIAVPTVIKVGEPLEIEKPVIPLSKVPKRTSGGYAFESGVIRLNDSDFKCWELAFVNLDLRSELLSLTQWAETQGGKWFHAVAGALAKRNREIGIKLKQASASPGAIRRHTVDDPMAGII